MAKCVICQQYVGSNFFLLTSAIYDTITTNGQNTPYNENALLLDAVTKFAMYMMYIHVHTNTLDEMNKSDVKICRIANIHVFWFK